MAVRAKRQLDPKEAAKAKQIEDRVRRARASMPPRDVTYYERCGELAHALGMDPGEIFEEFDERAGARGFCGNVSRVEAERLAFLDVLERFERQKRIA